MTRFPPRLVAVLVLVAALLGFAPSAALANDSDARPEFRIEVPDGMDGMADALRDAYPGVRQSVGELIGSWHNGDLYVFVARNRDGMRRILTRLGMPGVRLSEHIAGLAIPSRSLILLNIAPHRDGPVISRTLATFRHEYCHLLMGKYSTRAGRQWPSWFEEGVCQWVQQSGYEPSPAVIAARDGRVALPSLAEVSRRIESRNARTPAAYGFSQNAVGFLMRGIPRDQRAGQIAGLGEHFVQAEGDFALAFEATFGEPLAEFEARWREHASASNTLEAVWMFIVHHHITLLFAGCGLIMVIGLLFHWRARRRFLRQREPGEPVAVLAPHLHVLPGGADRGHATADEGWNPADVDPEGEIARIKRERREQHERNRLAKLARKARRDHHQPDSNPPS